MACKAIGDQVPAITPVSAPFPPPLLKHWAAFSWASLLSASGFLHMLFLLFFGWDTAASYFGSQFKWHGIKVGIPRLHLGRCLCYSLLEQACTWPWQHSPLAVYKHFFCLLIESSSCCMMVVGSQSIFADSVKNIRQDKSLEVNKNETIRDHLV